MAIEIVSFPIENGGSFHRYVNVYQRVNPPSKTIAFWVVPYGENGLGRLALLSHVPSGPSTEQQGRLLGIKNLHVFTPGSWPLGSHNQKCIKMIPSGYDIHSFPWLKSQFLRTVNHLFRLGPSKNYGYVK